MAKEATIRRHCIDILQDDDWVLCVPTRSRFGSSRTYAKNMDWHKGVKGTDDYYSIFDLQGWRGKELLFVQYTSARNGTSACRKRQQKIDEFIERNKLECDNMLIQVWGHVKGKYFRVWLRTKEGDWVEDLTMTS